jgi:uncharacterized short protein YbdD (DUF466 family)
MRLIAQWWSILRELAGDDAYERYREHHMHTHAHEPLLTRRAYYAKYQQEKWSGINRCC